MEKKPIYTLHAEHTEWRNRILFYRDDLNVLKKRLDEVASRNTDKEIQAMVEHFENRMIVQKEQSDILLHDINEYEKVIEIHLMKNDTAADQQSWNDHTHLHDRVMTFEMLFNELRKDLIAFVAKWL
jgi:hypothetical protein